MTTSEKILKRMLFAGVVWSLCIGSMSAQALLITFETPVQFDGVSGNSDLIDNVTLLNPNSVQVAETFDSPFGVYFMDDIDPFADPDTGVVTGERDISFDYSITCLTDCFDVDDGFGVDFFLSFTTLSGDSLIDEYFFEPGFGTISVTDVAVSEQYGFAFELLNFAAVSLDAVLTISNLDISLSGMVEPPAAVPVPGALLLFMTGLAGLALRRRRATARRVSMG